MEQTKDPAIYDKAKQDFFALADHIRQLKPEQRSFEFSLKNLAKKAKNNRLWVFDPEIKAWYTPEEFVSLCERYTTGQEKLIQRVRFKDPFEGIEAAYHQMNSLQSRAKAFTLKVLEYYNK